MRCSPVRISSAGRLPWTLAVTRGTVPEAPNIRIAELKDAPRLHQLHTASIRDLCASQYAWEIIEGWLINRTPGGYASPPHEKRSLSLN